MTINPNIIVDAVYPIGSVYITINSVSPSTLFGGTWKQITSDAYLKIVSSNAGKLGGTSSSHKIPVSSMPAHTHMSTQNTQNVHWYSGNTSGYYLKTDSGLQVVVEQTYTGSTGGSNAYYPYYYGVYVWVRTA